MKPEPGFPGFPGMGIPEPITTPLAAALTGATLGPIALGCMLASPIPTPSLAEVFDAAMDIAAAAVNAMREIDAAEIELALGGHTVH